MGKGAVMIHTYLVTVETDDHNIDAPTDEDIRNELQSTLEWFANEGIESVFVKFLNSFMDCVVVGQTDGKEGR